MSLINAQEEHGHQQSRNEIGFGILALYSLGHDDLGIGVHLHYFRTLKLNSKWSLGGGIEQAWIDGCHINVGTGVKYQLFDRLSLGLMPGVTIFSHNKTEVAYQHEYPKVRFTLHYELAYELFHWEHFHLGIACDYSQTKDDSHVAGGIHIAFCF